MNSLRRLAFAVAVALGLLAVAACSDSAEGDQSSSAVLPSAPDITVPAVRAVGSAGFESGQFTLSGEKGNPWSSTSPSLADRPVRWRLQC